MKVLIIQNRFYPAIGGTEKHTYLLGKYLVEDGHDVTVFTTDSLSGDDMLSFTLLPPFIKRPKARIPLPREEVIDGIKVVRFNITARLWSFNWIPEMFRELRKHTRDYDVIHIHGYHVSTSLAGCYYAKKYHKPVILTPHDLIIPDNMPADARLLKKVYDKTVGRYILKNSTRLIALTDDHIAQYTKRGGSTDKIRIAPNGIELRKYLADNGADLSRFGIGNSKVLLFVGRLEKHKGVQDLIEIMPAVLKEVPDTKLLIVGGDYGCLQKLNEMTDERRINDRVIFTGNVKDAELLQLFRSADIFAFPSKMEGFGIVLLEAMASGTLCIAYPIPAVNKIIENGVNGVMVNNKQEMMEKIVYYLKNPGEKASIEKNASEFVRSYDIKNIVRGIEGIYQEAIDENKLGR